MSGWVFIGAGVLLIGMGSLSIYYGQDLLRRNTGSAPVVSTPAHQDLMPLGPQQEKLLSLIHKYQVQFGVRKLIIGRDGFIYFDEAVEGTSRTTTTRSNVNISEELLGTEGDPQARAREFETLMESLPTEYLRMIPEFRLDSPYVVSVTDEGIAYLKK